MKVLFSVLFVMLSLPSAAHAGREGNGGSFIESAFRKTAVEKVLPAVMASPHIFFDREVLRTTVAEMRVEVSSRPLRHSKKGYVDALNFPHQKLIQLYVYSWEEKIRRGRDLRLLVLHELLGLMQVEDDDYQVSSKYFPRMTLGPDFSHDVLVCDVFGDIFRLSRPGPGRFGFEVAGYVSEGHVASLDLGEDLEIFPGRPEKTKRAEMDFSYGHPKDDPEYRIHVSALLRNGRREEGGSPSVTYRALLIKKRKNQPDEIVGSGFATQRNSEVSEIVMTNNAFENVLISRGIDISGPRFNAWWAIRDHLGPMGEFPTWETEYYPKVHELLQGLPNVIPALTTLECWTGERQFIDGEQ